MKKLPKYFLGILCVLAFIFLPASAQHASPDCESTCDDTYNLCLIQTPELDCDQVKHDCMTYCVGIPVTDHVWALVLCGAIYGTYTLFITKQTVKRKKLLESVSE